MTRGKWLLVGFGIAIATIVAIMRFLIGPTWAQMLVGAERDGPMTTSTTRWGVWLFDNPITADTQTRMRFLIYHSVALLMEQDPEGAMACSEKALELGKKLNPTNAWNQFALGLTLQALAKMNKPARATAVMNRWISRVEEQHGKDHPSLVQPLTIAANIAEQSNQRELAQSLAERAVAIILKRSGPYDRALALPLDVLQRVALAKQDWDSAMQIAEQRKEVEKREGSTDAAVVEWRHARLMRRFAELKGDDDKAYDFCRQLVSGAAELVSAGKIEPSEAVIALGQAVRFARKIGRSDEAIAWTESVIQLPGFEQKVDPATRAFCYLTLLEDLVETARYSRTKEVADKCFTVAEQLGQKAAPHYLERVNKLAARCSERGHPQLAKELSNHADRLSKDIHIPTTAPVLASPPSMFLPAEPPPPFGISWGWQPH
ncbi:MAG: hypothetical protein N2Z21_06625 [Candidatus Sumerlaeaceae bacterium]|nr:hypothetical protein [Candidatus Sumerlaeaceae bacterium]